MERGTWIAIAIIVAAGLLVTGLTVVAGRPVGIDTPGHLFKAWAIAHDAEKHLFSLHGWTQYWYNGHPLYYYYPPASYFVLGALDYVLNNIDLSYRLFIFIAYVTAGAGAYVLGRLWLGKFAATSAALFYLLGPYTMKTVFWEGNLPRTLGLALLPFGFYLIVKALDTGRRPYFVWLAPAAAVLVFTHLMPALSLFVLGGVFVPIYAFARVPTWRVFAVGAMLLIGVGLSMVWLLPATTQSDLPEVPNLAVLLERLPTASTDANTLLNPLLQWRAPNATPMYLGLAGAAAAAIGLLLWRVKRAAIALAAAATLGILLSMGSNSPIFPLIDNYDVFTRGLPYRWLQAVTLFTGILGGAALQEIAARRYVRPLWLLVGVSALFGLVAVDSAAFLRATQGIPERGKEVRDAARAAEWLKKQDGGHRVFAFTAFDWSTGFAPARIADMDLTTGWNPEGTPYSVSISLTNRAIAQNNYDWVERNLFLWDASYALVNENGPIGALPRALEERGWTEIDLPFEVATLRLLQRPNPTPGRLLYNPLDVATVGTGGAPASLVSPNVADGRVLSDALEDQDPDYLSLFDTVLLFGYRFRSPRSAETSLRPLLERGATVVDALELGRSTAFFDAAVEPRSFQGRVVFRNGPGVDLLPPEGIEAGPFQYQGGPWTGPVITGGADPLIVADIGGERVTVVAAKPVAGGRMVYLGLSLMTQAASGDRGAIDTIRTLLGYDRDAVLSSPPFPARNLKWGEELVSFDYSTDDDATLLLSMTYFPAWRATIDGKPLSLYRHDRLTLMRLPRGEHSVRMTFGMTATQRKAGRYSLLAFLLFLGVIAWPAVQRPAISVLGLAWARAAARLEKAAARVQAEAASADEESGGASESG